MRDLFAWSQERSLRFAWGSASKEGTVFPCLDIGGESYWPYRLRSSGVIEFQFYWMARRTPFDAEDVRHQFRLKLNEIEGVDFGPRAVSKQPSIPVALLGDADRRKLFDAAIEWFFETARAAHLGDGE
jgi:hypothetical protein